MLNSIQRLGSSLIPQQLVNSSKNTGKLVNFTRGIFRELSSDTIPEGKRVMILPGNAGKSLNPHVKPAPSAPKASSFKLPFQEPTGSEQKFFKGGVLAGVLLTAAGVGVASLPMDVDHTDPDFPVRTLKGEESLDQTRVVRLIGEGILIPLSISTEKTADSDFPIREMAEARVPVEIEEAPEAPVSDKIRKAVEKREAEIAKDRARAEKELNTAVKDIQVTQEKADRLLKQMKGNSAPLTALSPSSWGKALRASSDYIFSASVYQDLDKALAKGDKAVKSEELEVPMSQKLDAQRVITEGTKASAEIKGKVREITGEHQFRSRGIAAIISAATISAVGVIAWSTFSR